MAAFTAPRGRRVEPKDLAALQASTQRIRNVCILAHVDHGKTTLSDGLVSSNGIISEKLAGKLRYLDSTEDEQIRGITMKSSAISLLYRLEKPKQPASAPGSAESSKSSGGTSPATFPTEERSKASAPPETASRDEERTALGIGTAAAGDYLVNLIDSPGHIDFSSDVSTATRLCDIGLVVVDVLEGVCPQTHAVLRQAWSERMRPLLVLNKVDRLATELQLTPLEAWQHLHRVVENVNALTASLVASRDLERQQQTKATGGSGGNGGGASAGASEALAAAGGSGGAAASENDDYLEAEGQWTFRPEMGDVVFASALDGWGFGLGHFARLWAKRLNCPPKKLRHMLWGDFVLNSKTMKVLKWNPASSQLPLFASMILEPIWQLYDVALLQKDAEKAGRMAVKIGLQVPPRELKHSDGRVVLQSIMRRWLPVADALLRMVADLGPSPREAQPERLDSLWPASDADTDAAAAVAVTAAAAVAVTAAAAAAAASTPKAPGDDDAVAAGQGTPGFAASAAGDERGGAVDEGNSGGGGSEEACNGDKSVLGAITAPLPAAAVATEMAAVRAALSSCDTSPTAPVVIFVSKMVAVKRSELKDLQGRPWQPPGAAAGTDAPAAAANGGEQTNGHNGEADEAQELVLVAFARIFSGTVRCDTLLHVLGPRYHPLRRGCGRHMRGLVGGGGAGGSGALALYMMMGTGLFAVSEVPAGNVLAIAGLEGRVQKCATLSSTLASPALRALSFQARPIMRVAVEATRQKDMAALERGLGRLYQADPAAEVSITDRGEHIISCLGELHLEQCLKDLRERYARVEFTASPPLVAFRETVLLPAPVAAAAAAAAASAASVDATDAQRSAGPTGGSKLPSAPGAAGASAAAPFGAANSSEEFKPNQLATPPWSDEEGLAGTDCRRGVARVLSANRQAALVVRCRPLPAEAARLLDESPEQVRALVSQLAARQPTANGAASSFSASSGGALGESGDNVTAQAAAAAAAAAAVADDYMAKRASRLSAVSNASDGGGSAFQDAFVRCLEAAAAADSTGAAIATRGDGSWDDFVDRILAFGPRHSGPNILAAPAGGGLRVPVRVVHDSPALEEGPPRSFHPPKWAAAGSLGAAAAFNAHSGGPPSARSDAGDRDDCEAVENTTSEANIATLSNGRSGGGPSSVAETDGDEELEALVWRSLGSAIVAGFELAAAAGPLAGEEMHGVVFTLERIEVAASCLGISRGGGGVSSGGGTGTSGLRPQFGPLSGQLISAGKVACRAAFLCCPARLVEAFYCCELQCDQLQLGNMYAVLSRRRGRVTKEDLVEGTQLFLLDSLLPVAESFGFANELLKRTSGAGTTPQLAFSHWEAIDVDPFWRPLTEEEREDEGESGHLGALNIPRRFIDAIRRRKGLATADKIVVAAEKQRTLTRNK